MSGDIGIGKIIEPGDNRGRDAVHIAVAPVVAACNMYPGNQIGILTDGKASTLAPTKIGIVDPFLEDRVEKGQTFYVFLFPGSITSLRHEWVHPAFKDEEFNSLGAAENTPLALAHARIAQYAESVGIGYDEMMQSAQAWLDHGEYHTFGFDTPDEAYEGNEQFWKDYELVTGKTITEDKRKSFFSCAC